MQHQQVLDYLAQQHAELNAEGEVVLSVAKIPAASLMSEETHAFLTGYALLQITGADAESFLQSQFSSDVKALSQGGAQWSSYSNAKGRMQASFLLWYAEDGYCLMLRKDIAETFRKRLSMFVMRSKVSITLQQNVLLLGEFQPQASSGSEPYLPRPDGRKGVLIGSTLRISLLRDDAPLPALSGTLVDGADFDLYFIAAGIPWVSAATYEAFVPQMANMDLIGGISFRKGCYPGQEIVARTQYLGKVKRRLFRVMAEGAACPAGADIYSAVTGEQAIGKVVSSVAIAQNRYCALVVMQIAAWDSVPYLSLSSRVELVQLDMPYLIPELSEA